MTTFEQLPGELNIEGSAGDDLSLALDFDIALTGYTFESKVVHSGTTTTITVTNTNLSEGQITLSLTDAEITALGIGTWYWYLTWACQPKNLTMHMYTCRVQLFVFAGRMAAHARQVHSHLLCL